MKQVWFTQALLYKISYTRIFAFDATVRKKRKKKKGIFHNIKQIINLILNNFI